MAINTVKFYLCSEITLSEAIQKFFEDSVLHQNMPICHKRNASWKRAEFIFQGRAGCAGSLPGCSSEPGPGGHPELAWVALDACRKVLQLEDACLGRYFLSWRNVFFLETSKYHRTELLSFFSSIFQTAVTQSPSEKTALGISLTGLS